MSRGRFFATFNLSPKPKGGSGTSSGGSSSRSVGLPIAYVLTRQIIENINPWYFLPDLIRRSLPPPEENGIGDDNNDNTNGSSSRNDSIASPPRPDVVRVHYAPDASTYLVLNPGRVLGRRRHADYDDDDDDERRPIAVRSVHVFLSMAVVDRGDQDNNNNNRRRRDLMLMDPYCSVADLYDAFQNGGTNGGNGGRWWQWW